MSQIRWDRHRALLVLAACVVGVYVGVSLANTHLRQPWAVSPGDRAAQSHLSAANSSPSVATPELPIERVLIPIKHEVCDLTLKFVDWQGQPIPNVIARLTGDGQARLVQGDAVGIASVEGLSNGTYSVSIEGQDYLACGRGGRPPEVHISTDDSATSAVLVRVARVLVAGITTDGRPPIDARFTWDSPFNDLGDDGIDVVALHKIRASLRQAHGLFVTTRVPEISAATTGLISLLYEGRGVQSWPVSLVPPSQFRPYAINEASSPGESGTGRMVIRVIDPSGQPVAAGSFLVTRTEPIMGFSRFRVESGLEAVVPTGEYMVSLGSCDFPALLVDERQRHRETVVIRSGQVGTVEYRTHAVCRQVVWTAIGKEATPYLLKCGVAEPGGEIRWSSMQILGARETSVSLPVGEVLLSLKSAQDQRVMTGRIAIDNGVTPLALDSLAIIATCRPLNGDAK